MSISPPSDLILDVARAADPKRAEAAAQKLASAANLSTKDAFTAFVDPAGKHGGAFPSLDLKRAVAMHAHAAPQAKQAADDAKSNPVASAYRALGAVLVQQMIETMMPKNKDGAIFGQGAAGSAWKSMMAQQLASHMSESIFKKPISTAPGHRVASHEAAHIATPMDRDQKA